jgi:hypothetical protein
MGLLGVYKKGLLIRRLNAERVHLSICTVFNLKSSGFKKLEIDTVEQLREVVLK